MSAAVPRSLLFVGLSLLSATLARVPHAVATGVAERSLQELSPAAAAYLATRQGSVAVAVTLPDQHTVYSTDANTRFPLASLAKVGIMVTVMDRSIREHRALTTREVSLMDAMITRSDNDAASTLWAAVGGGPAVGKYLHSIGLGAYVAGSGTEWGESLDTAGGVAQLLAKLADGTILDSSRRGLALVLMNRIIASQRWGVTKGLPKGAMLAFKNGWDESGDGRWELNSAGIVIPGSVKHAYTLAILTRNQPNLQYGLQTIQKLSELIHDDIASRSGNAATQQHANTLAPSRDSALTLGAIASGELRLLSGSGVFSLRGDMVEARRTGDTAEQHAGGKHAPAGYAVTLLSAGDGGVVAPGGGSRSPMTPVRSNSAISSAV